MLTIPTPWLKQASRIAHGRRGTRGYLKRTLGDGGPATLSAEGDPVPPRSPPPPPEPAPAPGEAGADLRRRSATPLTMFIAPDPALAAAAPAAAGAHHRRGEDDDDAATRGEPAGFDSNPIQQDAIPR